MGSEAHQFFLFSESRRTLSGKKRLGQEVHSPPYTDENECSHTSTPPIRLRGIELNYVLRRNTNTVNTDTLTVKSHLVDGLTLENAERWTQQSVINLMGIRKLTAQVQIILKTSKIQAASRQGCQHPGRLGVRTTKFGTVAPNTYL
jgi:hypothetical protein